MAKKNIFKNKSLWKKIGLGCLAGALTIGAIAGVSALVKESEETTKIINPTYAVGGLTENGAYLETEGSLYTENAFECQGLDIELDFKSNISYRVFFYDNENDFLSSTPKLTANYDEDTTPLFARFARVVITPNEDEEIKWYEKSGYANQLTISVDKEQDFDLTEKLANYENVATIQGQGIGAYKDGVFEFIEDANSPFYFVNTIDVSSAETLIIKLKTSSLTATSVFGTSNYPAISILDVNNTEFDLINNVVSTENGCSYLAFDVSNLNTICGYVDVENVDVLEIFVI